MLCYQKSWTTKSCSGKVGDVATGGQLSAAKEDLAVAVEYAQTLEASLKNQARQLEKYEDFVGEAKELYDALYACSKVHEAAIMGISMALTSTGRVTSGMAAIFAAETRDKCGPWAKQHDRFDWSP